MTERYALAYSVTRERWYIYIRGTDDRVSGWFKTREAALARLTVLEQGA